MEMTGQLYTPVVFPQGKKPRFSLDRKAGRLDALKKIDIISLY
jgi:hypothetical protein